MKSVLGLSYRYKIPLWGGLLIVVTALFMFGSFIISTYEELEEDLLLDSESMGYSLKTNLFSAMLHDDLWKAYEIISAPIKGKKSGSNPINAGTILVVDNALRVVVSAPPKSAPMLTDLRQLSPDFAEVADQITQMDGISSREINLRGSKHYYFLTPISSEQEHLGTLIIVHPKDVYFPRFATIARRGLLTAGLLLAILIPFNWYWGRRMALPLVQLTERMENLNRKWPSDLKPELYAHHDEIGKLFDAYNMMLKDLETKEELEKKIVHSERMAALGQLSAGIAHEINNPLSGMLTAIDTLKCHGDLDPQTTKTISLVERGLNQIKDTVGALLVEAKIKSRNLLPQDIEDVLTLITPLARKKALHIGWHNSLDEEIPLPSTLLRQVIINLLLNAVQAAEQQGEVAFDIGIMDNQLNLIVTNNGKMLSTEQLSHLFEPFSSLSESGQGLGLWVTYQIVHQLGGEVTVKRVSNNQMLFNVSIPLGVEE